MFIWVTVVDVPRQVYIFLSSFFSQSFYLFRIAGKAEPFLRMDYKQKKKSWKQKQNNENEKTFFSDRLFIAFSLLFRSCFAHQLQLLYEEAITTNFTVILPYSKNDWGINDLFSSRMLNEQNRLLYSEIDHHWSIVG